jgi:uncharacterized protein YjbJ (UPF0337 family)
LFGDREVEKVSVFAPAIAWALARASFIARSFRFHARGRCTGTTCEENKGSLGTIARRLMFLRRASLSLTRKHHFVTEVLSMDWNRVEGNWKQVKGKVREKWGQLTSDDLDTIAGRRDQLEGKIQERYGIAKDQIRKDVDDWYAAQKW